MIDMNLNDNIIESIKKDAATEVVKVMDNDLVRAVLYGSCARGDYTPDSDVDIALLTKCDRNDAKRYSRELSKIATDIAMKYYQVVNFVCLPYDEFMEKKSWYPYFINIDKEGQVLYG